MRTWLTLALTVTTLQAFAADPPVEGERTQAQAYCTHKAEVISKRVYMFSRVPNDAAGRRKFDAYLEKAAPRNGDATADALQWLSENDAKVARETTKARHVGDQAAATLANNVAIEALENCQPNRIAHIRRSGALEAARSETLAEYKSRCPRIEDIQNKGTEELSRICPAQDSPAQPGG